MANITASLETAIGEVALLTKKLLNHRLGKTIFYDKIIGDTFSDRDGVEYEIAWATHIKRTRHIGDFTHWKNHNEHQKAFKRLLRDLKVETPHWL